MTYRILLLLFSMVAGAPNPSYAVWIGKGEVVGEVKSSSFIGPAGDRVHLVLAIESQTTNWAAPDSEMGTRSSTLAHERKT